MPDSIDPLFLGVDIGTYESKGVLVAGDGTVVASVTRAHTIVVPQEGWAEHDAETTWWDGFVKVTRQLLQMSGVDAKRVAAVCCSGIGPCVVPVDAEWRPLAPAILYGIDTRAREEIRDLDNSLGTDAVVARSGRPMTSQSAGPKIKWLHRHRPEAHSRAAHFLTCQSFVVARLTGVAVVDHATASYFDPLYDFDHGAWDVTGCEDFVVPAQLPAIRWATELAGTVTRAAAEATGLSAGTAVLVGSADAPAEAVSAGVSMPGDLMVMYGSSSFMIELLSARTRSSVLWPAPFVFPDTYSLAAGTSTAGTLTHWLGELLGLEAVDGSGGTTAMFRRLVELAAGSPPGANGLLTLPHFSGERTPVHDSDARGVIAGLSLRHGRGDIARSVIEGVAHSMAWALQCFDNESPQGPGQPRQLLAVGGGTRNAIWLQAMSDISGSVQHVAVSPGASFGDAIMAALATGYLASPSDARRWLTWGDTVTPQPWLAEMYRMNHARFIDLYGRTRGLFSHTPMLPTEGAAHDFGTAMG